MSGGAFSGGGSSSGGAFGGGSKPAATHHSSFLGGLLHGIAGFGQNLATDTYDAATGIPTGLVMTAEHPIKAAKAIGKQTWHDWAPLVEGHPVKFLQQTYAHPLAPLLDIATVFTAGAGAAARGAGALDAVSAGGRLGAEAGATEGGGLIKTLAGLRKPELRQVGSGIGRSPIEKAYGTNAGSNLRRLVVGRSLNHLTDNGLLPSWFGKTARETRLYDRLQHADDAHKLFAQHVQTLGMLKAAHAVGSTDHSVLGIVHPALLRHMYTNLKMFARPVDENYKLTPEEAFVKNEMAAAPKLKYDPMKQDFAQRSNSFGRDFTTTHPEQAVGNGHTGYLVVRKDQAKAYGSEAEKSTKFLRSLVPNATKYWKRINVGYAPRTVVNNTAGNYFMYLMKTAGHGGAHGLLDAIRHTQGERAVGKAFQEMHSHIVQTQGAEQGARFLAAAHPALSDAPDLAKIEKAFGPRAAQAVRKQPSWVNKYFKNEIGNTLGHALDMTTENVAKTGVKGVAEKAAKGGFYPFVHRVADQPVRVASLYQFMRKAPEVRDFLKANPGTKLDDAVDQVLQKNPNGLMSRATQHVRSVAGDYVTKSPVERMIQNVVPFYLWDKHIVNHLGSMADEAPGRLALAQGVSRQGNAENAKLLGNIPTWMQNSLPLSLLGMSGQGGRTPILSTQGINPYSTGGDLAQALAAYTTGSKLNQTGSDAASNLSPLLAGLAAQLTGANPGSSKPVVRHGGVIPSILENTAGGLGYATLIKDLLGHGSPNKNKKGQPTLYSKSATEAATSLLGLPVKEASLIAAQVQALKEQGIKKKKSAGGAFG